MFNPFEKKPAMEEPPKDEGRDVVTDASGVIMTPEELEEKRANEDKNNP
jgi:hypothetical protein